MPEKDDLLARIADLEATIKEMKRRPANQLGGDIQQASYSSDHHGTPVPLSVKGLLKKGVKKQTIQAAMNVRHSSSDRAERRVKKRARMGFHCNGRNVVGGMLTRA